MHDIKECLGDLDTELYTSAYESPGTFSMETLKNWELGKLAQIWQRFWNTLAKIQEPGGKVLSL